MSHFTKDVMKFGPAPTLAREIPVTIANLLFSILAVAVIIAVQGGVDAVVIVAAVVLVGYSLGRTAYVALRGQRTAGHS
ncbi:hypothetical protein GCM10007304_09710 [Rhodococcoides trifolii]|uniref:Uncharacterized protein n=1 Tax=Rhodococcoides trifolii TaxID=908250 RepID=A0A917CU47_9NOCA|nr:hypothetical protein [Rhodococcus trifolii]GGF97837.1 hypothetical protein GCM10007304_09710 [Rhodococcus trifolii]